MRYEFHRDFYGSVLSSLKKNAVTFLLGTRKCGKTVCFAQLNEDIPGSAYIDFKTVPDKYGQIDVFRDILDSIKNDEEKTYLLDEITYVENAEARICEMAWELAASGNTRTKIAITGSQSVALNAWADRAFAGNAGKISADFLSYPEFLRYKGLTLATPETYSKFLYEAADFYKFTSLKDYLEGCIEETVVSNAKASNFIFDNECDLIRDNVRVLVNICYQTMFTLHNSVKADTFFKDDKLKDTIIGSFHETCRKLGNEAIGKKIENSFIGSYSSIRSQDLDTLKQAFVFLKKCGLITITPIARDLEAVPDPYRSMRLGKDDIDCKKDLFEKFNVTINHPMFYVQILKDVLGEDMPQELPRSILGSIVECHARGLMPDGFEYRTSVVKNGIEYLHEVDHVDLSNNTATELTISRSHGKHFQVLPGYMRFVCLTRDENCTKDGIEYRDFCSFLCDLSMGKHPVRGEMEKQGPSVISAGAPQVPEGISDAIMAISGKLDGLGRDIDEAIASEKKKVARAIANTNAEKRSKKQHDIGR